MNRTLLREIKHHLIETPEKFQYPELAVDSNGTPVNPVTVFEDCGTMCCVAGWARAIHDKDKACTLGSVTTIQLLGITEKQFNFLCLGKKYKHVPSIRLSEATVVDAIRRIDYLLSLPE